MLSITKVPRLATAAATAVALTLSGAAAGAVPSADAARNVTTKCQVMTYPNGTVIGWVYGNGFTHELAKIDANPHVPRGAYKRHCWEQKQWHESGFKSAGGGSTGY